MRVSVRACVRTCVCACTCVWGFTLFTDSEGGSHMTRGSMPMREPVPARAGLELI